MFYNKDNLNCSLFNTIHSIFEKRSLKSSDKKENKLIKKFQKIHSVLWVEFILLNYLSEDELVYPKRKNTEE